MSHSSKHHKKKHEDNVKYSSSRVNVFQRLGENEEENTWHGKPSKSGKSQRNERHLEDREVVEKHKERWPSASKDPSRSSSKTMKYKSNEYQDEFKESHSHHMEKERRQVPDIRMKKQRSSPTRSADVARSGEYERGRKRKERSPYSSPPSSSISPPAYSSKQNVKRHRYQSPSPQPHVKMPANKQKPQEQERGRSREKKERKTKESKKEPPRDMKISRSYDSYADNGSQDYKEDAAEYRHKRHREFQSRESSRSLKESPEAKETKSQSKSRKHADWSDIPLKKHHHVIMRRESRSPAAEEPRYKSDSGKAEQQRHRSSKEDKGNGSDEGMKIQQKRTKKMENRVVEELKPKKKNRLEKLEQRPSSSNISKMETKERVSKEQRSSKEYSDDKSISESLTTPKHHKNKDSKYQKSTEYLSEDDNISKKTKIKKKKKQKQEDEVVAQAKKKLKHPKAEEQISTKKKTFEKQEEVKEKTKRIRKRKRAREDSGTSRSDSTSESSHPRKHVHLDSEWQTVDAIDDSPPRSHKKEQVYDETKRDRSPQREAKLRHKGDRSRRESPESVSSRNESRQRRSPIPPPALQHRRGNSIDRDSFHGRDSSRDDKGMRDDFIRNERRYIGDPPPQHRDRGYVDARADRHMDARGDRQADRHVDARADRRLDARTDRHADVRVDTRTGRNMDMRLDRHADSRADLRLDARADRHLDVRLDRHADSRADLRVDTRSDRHMDARIERRVDERGDHHMDARTDRHVDGRDQHIPMKDSHYEKRRSDGKSTFYDNKSSSRYYDKAIDPSFNDKRSYDRRNPDMQYPDKKVRYEESRGRDDFILESRKPRNDIPERNDSRHKFAQYPDARSSDFREFRNSPSQPWQPDRGRRPRDSSLEFESGTQRMASWVGGRDSGKLRIEARDPPLIREIRQTRPNRPVEREMHMERVDSREQRNFRHDPRETHFIQGGRNIPEKSWIQERSKHPGNAPKHRVGHYSNERNRNLSSERMTRMSDELSSSSPSFYREVRRNGEKRHLDLGIEVTIRDDGGRSSVDYDKSREQRHSPKRLVSSYETSRSKERPLGQMHREKSDSEPRRHNRKLSPRDHPMQHYQHRMKEVVHVQADRSTSRDRNSRLIESRKQSTSQGSYRGDVLKSLKRERPRLPVLDRSRDSSFADREKSRDSSGADRDHSRDSSLADRDRSHGSSRGVRHIQSRSDKLERISKTSRYHKSSSKTSSDRGKKDSKIRSGGNERKEKAGKPVLEAADVLDVDWTGISSPEKKDPPESEVVDSSILQHFSPGNVLLRMGVSPKLLPPDLLEKVLEKCEAEKKGNTGNSSLVLDRGLGALNRTETLRQRSWFDSFASKTSQIQRLTSCADAKFRQNILGLNEDLRFPCQPPQVINSKSYALSMKHYLNKMKLAVDAR